LTVKTEELFRLKKIFRLILVLIVQEDNLVMIIVFVLNLGVEPFINQASQ